MEINEFIQVLNQKEIKISFSKGKLQYTGPEKNIDKELLGNLKKFKSQLLKYNWPEECVNMMPVNTEGDKTPLTLLHAGPSNYVISDFLGKQQPYYGFFYIGSEGEKIRYKTLEEFAMAYLKQLQFVIPNGPYLLGGFSIGGNLAYDMAIKLQNQGHKVPLLVLVDSVLPALHRETGRKKIEGSLYSRLYGSLKSIYHLGINIWKSIYYGIFNLTKMTMPKDKRRQYILWNYKNLLKDYKPEEEFHGDILLFKAEENKSKYQYLGWEKVCKNITLITFPGIHGAMYNDTESIKLISTNIVKWVDKQAVTAEV